MRGHSRKHQFGLVATVHSNKLSIPIRISETEERTIETFGLINSGAGGKFIHQNYVKKKRFEKHTLETPIRAYNIDGIGKKNEERSNLMST